MPQLPPITKAFMLACVGFFCLFILLPEWKPWLALWPIASGNFMPWQMVSYAFLHGDTLHLFFNMLGLWMFGSELELVFGQRRYLQLLVASTLSAAAMQLLFAAVAPLFPSLFNVGPYSIGPTVGASGALFGLLLGFGMLFPDRVIMPLFPPIPMKAKVFVAVFGALELLMGLSGASGVAHFAHLGGMIGAWLLIRNWRSGRRR